MEKKQLENTDEGSKGFQRDAEELQRPAIRKDYKREAGKDLIDLEIAREIEAINVLATLKGAQEPAKQYKERTADHVNTELPRPENDERRVNGDRNKVPTEKGREYTLERIKNDRKTALSNVTRQINKIKPLLSSFSNEKLVRMKVKELDELFALMHGINQNYLLELNSDEEIKQATEWFDLHDKEVFTFKQSIVDYLHEAKEHLNEEFSRSSVKSKYSHSRRSYASGSSNRSQLIQAKAKTASLEATAAFLKETQALKMAAEELELRRMIAQAKAEEKVYEQFEHEECNQLEELDSKLVTSQENHTPTPHSYTIKPTPCDDGSLNPSEPTPVVRSKPICTGPVVQSTTTNYKLTESLVPKTPSSPEPVTISKSDENPSKINPDALPFFSKQDKRTESQVSTNLQTSYETPVQDIRQTPPSNNSMYDEFLKVQKKQASISEMIMVQQVRSSLPSHKPPIFSGDSMEYSRFMNAFELLIESKVESPIERLYFLDQYTTGKAKEVIKGCIQMKSDDSYGQAKALLKKHFGDPFKVANAYIAKLTKWPSVKAKDGQHLQEFAIALEQAKNATTGLPYMDDLNTAQVLRQLWEKLPLYLRSKWTERASKIRSAQSRNATFSEFTRFVTEQAEFASDPVFSEEYLEKLKEESKDKSSDSRRYQRSKSTRSFGTEAREKEEHKGRIKKCTLCSKPHDLDECEEFGKKTLPERKDLIRERGLCFGCLKPGHISSKCNDKLVCKTCEKKHPSVLHDPDWKSKSKKHQTTSKENEKNEQERVNSGLTACSITDAGDVPVNMGIMPIWLYHKSEPEKRIKVYALLDNGSGGTFVKKETMKRLGIDGEDTTLLLTTMHGTQEIETKVVSGLVAVNCQEEDVHLDLPRSFVREQIPTDREEIPRPEVAERFHHLQKISGQLTPYMPDIEVCLLIGLNCPKALRPREVIHGQDTEPYAVRSILGWYINGPISRNDDVAVNCNRVHVQSVNQSSGCIVTERDVKEEIAPKAVERMFELDFLEKAKGLATSKEDREFLKKIESGIVHREDSHYEMPLPFKEENVTLPNNRSQAEQRLKCLKKRLLSDERYRQDYVSFMNNIVNKGYATQVSDKNATASEGHVWYLPHHGVYHRQKTDSPRVVFDCSARYQGESLNDHLLQGPDLTSKLTGVLIRFREEKIAVMADVEKMFYQVKVTEPDQNYLRFLWWPDSDLTKEPVDYCMTVHLFGGASSPGCSNFALKRTADDHEEEFGSDIADTLRNNFYVDDMLKSVPTDEKAIEVVQGTKAMCKKGGFKLTKFVSNSRKVLESVPEEDRAKEIKGLSRPRAR